MKEFPDGLELEVDDLSNDFQIVKFNVIIVIVHHQSGELLIIEVIRLVVVFLDASDLLTDYDLGKVDAGMLNFYISLLFGLLDFGVFFETGDAPGHVWVFVNNLLDDFLLLVMIILTSLHHMVTYSILSKWWQIWVIQEIFEIAVFMFKLFFTVGLTCPQQLLNLDQFFLISFKEIIKPLNPWHFEENW